MNTPKDPNKKFRMRNNTRNKNFQGYFHNTRSNNFKNRNSSFQAHNQGYAEQFFQNASARSHNIRHSSYRPNSGYFKHPHLIRREKNPSSLISAESIRIERVNSSIGSDELEALRRIRATSDMIKKHLMSTESSIAGNSETGNDKVDSSEVSDLKASPLTKSKRKPTESSEESISSQVKEKKLRASEGIARQNLKTKRKNELREKFKKDCIARQKSNETYDVKEISDKILQHISTMNKNKLAEFLDSDNYGDSFNYIFKQKSFELTKALRDLSCQEKPETCEIVNAVIPDFSIKIEELPIEIIKALSSNFDELHKNLGDETMSSLQDTVTGPTGNTSKNLLSSNHSASENTTNVNTKNPETTIEISDSDEENLLKKDEDNQSQPPTGFTLENAEVSSTLAFGFTIDHVETISSRQEEEDSLSLPMISTFKSEGSDSSNTVPIETHQNYEKLVPDMNNVITTDLDIPKNIFQEQTASILSTGVGIKEEETENQSLPEKSDLNLHPKIGSVWISKNIFPNSVSKIQTINEEVESLRNSYKEFLDKHNFGGQNQDISFSTPASIPSLHIDNSNQLESSSENYASREDNSSKNQILPIDNEKIENDTENFVLQSTSFQGNEAITNKLPYSMSSNTKNIGSQGANEKSMHEMTTKITSDLNVSEKTVDDPANSTILSTVETKREMTETLIEQDIEIKNTEAKKIDEDMKTILMPCEKVPEDILQRPCDSPFKSAEKKNELELLTPAINNDFQPKIGSVWVSKEIFPNCDNQNEDAEKHSPVESFDTHFPSSNDLSTPAVAPELSRSLLIPENNKSEINDTEAQNETESCVSQSTSCEDSKSGNDVTNSSRNSITVESQKTDNVMPITAEIPGVNIWNKFIQELSSSISPSSVGIDKAEIPSQNSDCNMQPEKGSIWVSKDIFPNSTDNNTTQELQNATNFSRTLDQETDDVKSSVIDSPNIIDSSKIVENASKSTKRSMKQSTGSGDNVLPVVKKKQARKNNSNEKRNEQNKTEQSSSDQVSPEIPTKNPNEIISPQDQSSPKKEIISLTINHFEKPKSITDAIEIMKLIDEKIDMLNKLRQNIFIDLSLSSVQTEKVISENTTPPLSVTSQLEPKKTEVEPFSCLKSLEEVILFCKILTDQEEFIVGTDSGQIHYYKIFGEQPFRTIKVCNGPLTFMKLLELYNNYYICAGNNEELELKIFHYKTANIERKLKLEDPVQVLRHEWGFIFIGGKRGYLTRYDWKKKAIQYEDRISAFGIKDLRATKEGARRILLICFQDADGTSQIHVRDAMTVLHIRALIEIKNLSYMCYRYSLAYLITDVDISFHNFHYGSFVRRIPTNKSFTTMIHQGNLLLLADNEGIYGFNMKTNWYLGCIRQLKCISSMAFYGGKILCCTTERKIKLVQLAERYRIILDGY